MQPDAIQIGPLLISRAVFDALLLLAGVVVGGLMTYLTTRAIENKKWTQQKQDRLQQYRREALGLALEWIPPIEIALYKASSLASRHLKNEASEDEMRKQWPKLLSELARRDLPIRLNVLIPQSIRSQSNAIVRRLDDLHSTALSARPVNKFAGPKWTTLFQATMKEATELQTDFDRLKEELVSEYNKTFK